MAHAYAAAVTRTQIDQLLSDTGPISKCKRAEFKSAAGFPDVVRRTAAALVEQHRGNRLVNAIISDRGRFFAALLVLDLHFRRDNSGVGLTPGRLKDACTEHNICSATRAGALLALMKLGGFVEPAPRRHDRRLRELVPTEKLFAQQRARWRCYLEGAEPLLPDAPRALAALTSPAFVEGVIRLMSAYLRAGFRFVDHAPGIRLFTERNGGMFVLFSLLADEEDEDGPIPVSISQLARGISTSRVHVVKLLKDAEVEGLLTRRDDGSVLILPPLRRDIFEFFALGTLMLTHFASITLAEMRQVSSTAHRVAASGSQIPGAAARS